MPERIKLDHVYSLGQDNGTEDLQVIPVESIGFGELFRIERYSDGKPGYIFFQANGNWWWVRHPDSEPDDNEPWKP